MAMLSCIYHSGSHESLFLQMFGVNVMLLYISLASQALVLWLLCHRLIGGDVHYHCPQPLSLEPNSSKTGTVPAPHSFLYPPCSAAVQEPSKLLAVSDKVASNSQRC